jgi:ribosomal protein S18 acetylase RimI-like enzyme
MSAVTTVALRPATVRDLDFVLDVERQTMREYAIATWGSWSEDQVQARAVKNLRAGLSQVVELAGEPIGTQVVERTADHIRLLQLFIVPAHQRQGIGSELVRRLIHEARERGVPLKLRVLKVNPAQKLYKRSGFSVVDETSEHVYMQYAI